MLFLPVLLLLSLFTNATERACVNAATPAAPTTYSTSLISSTELTFSWNVPSPAPKGYIVLMTTGSTYPNTAPTNGKAYTKGNIIGNATMIYTDGTPLIELTGLTAGTVYSFVVYSFNSEGAATIYSKDALQVQVTTLSAPSISYSGVSSYYPVNTAITTLTPINTGGAATSYAIIGTALPTGLSLNTTTGVISGTPSAAVVSKTYTIRATNSVGNSSTTITFATSSLITPTVTVTPVGTYTYNAAAQGPNAATNTGTGTSYTFSYVGTGSTTYGPSATAPTNPGTYTVTVIVDGNGSYARGVSSATAFTISPAALTITATAQSKTYSTTLALGTVAFTTSGLKGTDAINAVSLTSTGSANTAATGVYLLVPSAAVFATGSSSNYAISYANSTLTVTAGTAGVWVGLTSSDINTLSNWQRFSLPAATDKVTIPAGTPFTPALSVVATINDLEIASGATLNLNGKSLIINGAITGAGTITCTPTSSLTVNGSAGTLSFTPGSNTIQNLTLNAGASATLGSELNIVAGITPGSVTIASGATLTTGGNLVLKSDINSTARIAESAGSISGDVTVERYISAKASRKYSYISSPVSVSVRNSWQQQFFVSGPGIGGVACGATTGNGGATDRYNSNGFDATQMNSATIYRYNPTLVNGSRYVGIANTEATNLTPGTGYIVNIRGNRNSASISCANQLGSNTPAAPEAVTLSAKGKVTIGDVTVALNDPAIHAFTLVANPYPCQISFSAFKASNSNINNNIWTYNPGGNGNYTTYSNGIIVNGAANYDNTNANYIASGQAFFVQANAAGSVTFHENHKTNGVVPNAKYFGTTLNKIIRIAMKDAKDSALLDEIVVRYNNNGSATYNQSWDASSLSSGSQALASLKGTKRLAIATHPESVAADTTKLYVKSSTVGSFKLSFSDYQTLDNSQAITIVDKYLGTKQNIRANQVYDFKVTSDTASFGNNRFEVIVGGANTLPVNFTTLSATKTGSSVTVKWNTANEANIAKYEVERSSNGVAFATVNIEKASAASSYSVEDANISSNVASLYYRIKAVGTDGTTIYSAIAKVSIVNSQLSINIYPNPVKRDLNVTLSNAATGTYSVRIVTIAGNEVYGKAGAALVAGKLTMDASNFAAGVYVLELTDAKGNKQQEKFIKE